MSIFQNKKNKVVLSDYNYLRDIENRLLLADLTCFEVDVLSEIVNGSLKTSIKQLADTLEVSDIKLIPVLEKLSKTKLFFCQGPLLFVDKEMRKYYETQLVKFDEQFFPGIEFIQTLLNKLPIHILPIWYSISRCSDNIFGSIIEKYLSTPKIYERYLAEIHFEDPILTCMMRDVFQAPGFCIKAHDLIAKYHLQPQQFEEYLLYLEYNFVCYLSYTKVDDRWEEVITPFYEWQEYLLFQNQNAPKTIQDVENIVRKHPHDFGFIQDLALLLKILGKKGLKIHEETYELSEKDFQNLQEVFGYSSLTPEHLSALIQKALSLHLAEIERGKLHSTEKASEWLKTSIQDQALTLYRQVFSKSMHTENLFSEKDIREAQKSLRRILHCGWILFDDFMRGFLAPIGRTEPVALKNKGKRWKYVLPSLGDEEILLMQKTIFERLFEVGMTNVGTYQGKLCFCLTPFGKMSLGE